MGPIGFLAAIIPPDLQCGLLACLALLGVLFAVDLTRGREPAVAWVRPRRRRKGVRRWTRG